MHDTEVLYVLDIISTRLQVVTILEFPCLLLAVLMNL